MPKLSSTEILTLEQVIQTIPVQREMILMWVREGWVKPCSPESLEFDEVDLARMHLIYDLLIHMDVNTEAVPIVLDLVDRLYNLNRLVLQDSNFNGIDKK